MTPLAELTRDALEAVRRDAAQRLVDFRARGQAFDLTRGKPSQEQLDLSNALLELPGWGNHRAADGADCRNYFGDPAGLPEARALFAPMLGVPPAQLLVGDNSSLALMHDAIVFALLHGVPTAANPGGDRPWRAEPIAFLCPAPGYDRHFAICEGLGIRMIPVALTGAGPDMDAVERLVAADPSIKAIWCVPQYSNPTGETYADETVERLAAMPTAAADFRVLWDNAYAVHHLTETRHKVANLLDVCGRHDAPERALMFASTSKITFAGAGLSLLAASPANLAWFTRHLARRTIGPDKLNQLRHVRLLQDHAGIEALMERHRRLLAPKFRAVDETFARLLGDAGVARWTKPAGGYFVSLDVATGSAKRVVALAAEAGIAVVPAGRTFPYGEDPGDANIRLAPSFPPVGEVARAAEGIALAVLVAAAEALLRAHNERAVA
ncbi:MAG TPA: aminotransferase class I/II-fold pyridoxal phosphate-dependent enzyme [Candidatus Sulfotelmatobacter sp.]|nr:aminotransferase class I/II-fold pyridoxal phosphate-dependent enzyme [Candidatus Sulfotelmatobacter sp.]